MSYTLRPYQQEAVNVAINWVRKHSEPAIMALATGSGKSLICAELAKILVKMSKKKILCLCPTAELVEQNYEKYLLTGNEASIYSASIGKSLRHDVVFATEGTFKSKALEQGENFSCVILDEAHRITPTIKKIISDMKKGNPNLRCIGMSASPYRLGTGYVYEMDENNQLVDETVKPYFKKLLITIGGKFLTEQGYLTPIRIGKIGAEQYDTSHLVMKGGSYTAESIDEAFVGHGKKTADIVADVIHNANGMNAKSVMFFGATIDHAKEIMASLPAYNSALITGETPKAERKQIITDFKAQKIRYLVNISVLTTGFDCTSVSIIAVLRKTESASLLQQIIGRALRLHDGKEYSLLLDYADNVNTHFPDGDVFNPQIKANKNKESVKSDIQCPDCNNINSVSLRPNPDGFGIDQFGYFTDLTGERVEYEGQHFPAHFSRRCSHVEVRGHNVFERCGYYWSYKECTECGHKNDLTARKCSGCSALLIDPNLKLIADFKLLKKDPKQMQTDDIEFTVAKILIDKRNNEYISVKFGTKHRIVTTALYESRSKFYSIFKENMKYCPKTITYKKKAEGYFHIYDFDRESDEVKLNNKLNSVIIN